MQAAQALAVVRYTLGESVLVVAVSVTLQVHKCTGREEVVARVAEHEVAQSLVRTHVGQDGIEERKRIAQVAGAAVIEHLPEVVSRASGILHLLLRLLWAEYVYVVDKLSRYALTLPSVLEAAGPVRMQRNHINYAVVGVLAETDILERNGMQ